jgi:hypothetical protein
VEAGIEPASDFDVSENGPCGCDNCREACAARALHSSGTYCLQSALEDAGFQRVLLAWVQMPSEIRQAIEGLAAPYVPDRDGGSS